VEKLKIVVAQINLLVGDLSGNAKRIMACAQNAINQHQADIVVFPELALSSYPPEDLLLRPGFYTNAERELESIIAANLNTTLILGHPQKIGAKYFNAASIITNGHLVDTYAKQLLPNYTVFDEKRYFSAGNKTCVFKLKNTKIGIIICEDLWFKEPAQMAVENGAEIIITLNASPFDHNKANVREKIIRERAKETGVPIIYANLVGGQDELVFDGGSMIVDEQAKIAQRSTYYSEDNMLVEFELGIKPKVLHQPLTPTLSEHENIYEALKLGVHDYIEKNHFPGAIIGLSGGIDSALTLAIAVDALGPERVRGVLMPSRFTAAMSNEDAIAQANNVNVHYDIINIEPIFETFLNSLAPVFLGYQPDTTEENLQARIRGMLLMALSNKTGSIVLTTGNKSEMSVGYATLYGDMAGGFCVLKDVFKTMVYQLAQYRNQISPIIPERVLTRAPSAELADNQTDQDSLPPYPILDEILRDFIEADMDPKEIYAHKKDHLDLATIHRVVAMVNRNEYKRRQAPIGIRITERAFGKDRRYPITSGYTKNL
jgi:NAD+ synthase (glutamine-hydrolysing)